VKTPFTVTIPTDQVPCFSPIIIQLKNLTGRKLGRAVVAPGDQNPVFGNQLGRVISPAGVEVADFGPSRGGGIIDFD